MLASPHDLSYFVELTETLNFSRASERIGISQPSLSTAIKRLEVSIGTALFIRSKTGVTLTQAGKRLLAHTKQLMQLWESVKSEALASHFEIEGSISFGCHPSVALYALSHFLPQLMADYPKLEINIKHDLSRRILEGIINLSIDIGIIVNPVRHPDLIIQKLSDDTVTFWHSSAHKNTQQKLASGDAVIICDPELMQTQWLLKNMQKNGFKYRRLLTSCSLEVIANLTAHGAGIGILPSGVAASITTHKLNSIAKMPVYHDEICLVYRHENRHIKSIQTISGAIKQHFRKEARS